LTGSERTLPAAIPEQLSEAFPIFGLVDKMSVLRGVCRPMRRTRFRADYVYGLSVPSIAPEPPDGCAPVRLSSVGLSARGVVGGRHGEDVGALVERVTDMSLDPVPADPLVL
jgi:hypothetical protein